MKEENCKCCHEVWNKSDIKENLCPNCYYYFKSIKKQKQNQKAIECLKETREYIFNAFMSIQPMLDICNFIENKIKELEGQEK